MWAPLQSGLVAAVLAVPYWRVIGAPWALALLVVVVLTMTGLSVVMLYRSDYAAGYGVLSALVLWLLMLLLACAAAAISAIGTGVPVADGAKVWDIGVAALTISLAFATSATLTYLEIKKQGASGEWMTRHVDPLRCILRAGAMDMLQEARAHSQWHWLAIGLGVNLPLAAKLVGLGTQQWLAYAAAFVTGVGAWIAARYCGPRMGRALFVLRWQKVTGTRLVHEHYEQIQAVRRTWFLSRWLMPGGSGGDMASLTQTLPDDRAARREKKRRAASRS